MRSRRETKNSIIPTLIFAGLLVFHAAQYFALLAEKKGLEKKVNKLCENFSEVNNKEVSDICPKTTKSATSGLKNNYKISK